MLIHKLMLPTLLSWSPRRVLLSNVASASRWRRSSILNGRKVLFLHQSEEVRALLTGRGQARAIWILLGAVVLFRVQIAVRPQLSLHTAHCRHLELQCLEQLFCTRKVRCPQSCFSQATLD